MLYLNDRTFICAHCGAQADPESRECADCGSGRADVQLRQESLPEELHENVYAEVAPTSKGTPPLAYVKTTNGYDDGKIYFISGAGEFDPIKIGFTTRGAKSRLHSLQTGNPVVLGILFEFDANWVVEAKLHKRFAEFRLSGEWFSRAPEILAFIEEKKTENASTQVAA